MKSIFKSVATLTLFSILTRLLGFLLRIYLSRTIGSEALGLYQVALSVFMVLLTIVTSGLTLIVSRMTASYRVAKDKKATSSLASVGLVVSLTISITLCVIVLVFKNLFAKLFANGDCINILIALLPALVFSSVYSILRGVMWGQDNYFALSITEFIEELAKVAFCILFLVTGMTAIQGALSVAYAFTCACLVSAVFVVVLYFLYGGKIGKPSRIYKSLIRQASPITAVRVIGSLVSPIIALILPAKLIAAGYSSSQALSVYGVAMAMTFPLLSLPSTLIGSLSTALVPDISMALAENNNEHIQKRVAASFRFALFIAFLIVPTYVAVGDLIGVFLYDNPLSGVLLEYSAWIMVPMGITNISSAILNSVGMEMRAFVNYTIGGVFTFLSIIFLTKSMGVLSLSFGMGINATITAFLNILVLKKKLKIDVKIFKQLVAMILCALPTMALSSFVAAILKNFLPIFFTIAISGVCAVLFFVLLCWVFNIVNVQSFVVQLGQRLKIKNFRLKTKKSR